MCREAKANEKSEEKQRKVGKVELGELREGRGSKKKYRKQRWRENVRGGGNKVSEEGGRSGCEDEWKEKKELEKMYENGQKLKRRYDRRG